MPTGHRQHLGRLGEQLAAEHFARLGYAVLARNHHTRFGELDLVLSDGTTLVFCEVKTRRLGSGEPFESLHPAKQAQVRQMAAAWLTEVVGPPVARGAALRRRRRRRRPRRRARPPRPPEGAF